MMKIPSISACESRKNSFSCTRTNQALTSAKCSVLNSTNNWMASNNKPLKCQTRKQATKSATIKLEPIDCLFSIEKAKFHSKNTSFSFDDHEKSLKEQKTEEKKLILPPLMKNQRPSSPTPSTSSSFICSAQRKSAKGNLIHN